MSYDQMLEVIQAHKEGKKIEYRCPPIGSWRTIAEPEFNFAEYDYRVKREPRVLHCAHSGTYWCTFLTKKDAEQYIQDHPCGNYTYAKFIEAVED